MSEQGTEGDAAAVDDMPQAGLASPAVRTKEASKGNSMMLQDAGIM